jgi:hypothetical protein
MVGDELDPSVSGVGSEQPRSDSTPLPDPPKPATPPEDSTKTQDPVSAFLDESSEIIRGILILPEKKQIEATKVIEARLAQILTDNRFNQFLSAYEKRTGKEAIVVVGRVTREDLSDRKKIELVIDGQGNITLADKTGKASVENYFKLFKRTSSDKGVSKYTRLDDGDELIVNDPDNDFGDWKFFTDGQREMRPGWPASRSDNMFRGQLSTIIHHYCDLNNPVESINSMVLESLRSMYDEMQGRVTSHIPPPPAAHPPVGPAGRQ